MEQMVLMVGILVFIYLGEKTRVGFYKIVAGALSLGMAFTLATDTFMMFIFIFVAIYAIASVFVSTTK